MTTPVDLGAQLVSLLTTSTNPAKVSQEVANRTVSAEAERVVADAIENRLLSAVNNRLAAAVASQASAKDVYNRATTRRDRLSANVSWKKASVQVSYRRREQSTARALVSRYLSMKSLVAKSEASVASWQAKYQAAATASAKKSTGRNLVSAERTRVSRVKTLTRYEAQINYLLSVYGY